MHSTILIFLDGVGIGNKDFDFNPFFKYGFKTFTEIFGQIPHLDNQYLQKNDIYLFPSDACMGVEGLPQSGTGQTSIFCGFNAPAYIGQHFGPYPYSTLVPLIKEQNIFHEFLKRNLSPVFANAYPQIFFDYINSGRQRLSVTSLSCILSGVKLKMLSDLRRGNALSAEIDNSRWVSRLNYNLPVIKPETAAKRLLRLSEKNHLAVFEFFHTDHLGHGRNIELMEETITTLDRFLYYVLTNVGKDTTVVICSDHGNFEDLSIKMHTRNPALTITAGHNASVLAEKIKALSDIKKSILEMYD